MPKDKPKGLNDLVKKNMKNKKKVCLDKKLKTKIQTTETKNIFYQPTYFLFWFRIIWALIGVAFFLYIMHQLFGKSGS